jgi:hypothetical protein
MRLCTPQARKLFALFRRGQIKLPGYAFGYNQKVLADFYLPILGDLRLILDGPSFDLVSASDVDKAMKLWVPAEPVDFCWQPEEIAATLELLEHTPAPRLLIQEEGGTHDGHLKKRKLWGADRYLEIARRWRAKTGGGVLGFGPKSEFPCHPSLRVATLLGYVADLVLGPESAAKYFGPLFRQRCVTIWSQHAKFSVQQQLEGWYGPIDHTGVTGREHVLGIGNANSRDTSIDEVWDAMEDVIEQPRGKRKIALATATRDRTGYLTQMLDSVEKTQWPLDADLRWYFSDDASREDVHRLLKDRRKNLELQMRGSTHVMLNARPLGCDRNVLQAIYTALSSEPDWVCAIDSDMIVHPRWLAEMLRVIDWAEANDEPLMAITAFNSRMHGEGPVFCEGAVRKGSLGGPCTMIRADLLRDLQLQSKATIYWGRGEPGWDWKMAEAIQGAGGHMVSLVPSYAQHIGEQGAHALANNFDMASDFVGTEL